MALVEFDPRVPGFVRPVLRGDATDIDRVAEVVHYVIARPKAGVLGHVKLNKILWYSDLEHYRWHGASITGLRQYSRTPQGPMSQEISRAVGQLVKQKKVAERTVKVAGIPRREIIRLELPDVGVLNQKQTDIVNRMIRTIVSLTATQLSQMTCDDRLWQQVNNGEAMTIATASIMTQPIKPQ